MKTDLGHETLLVDVTDGVATVTYNRPDRMNAMNHEMGLAYHRAMNALEADPEVRAIVVTGAGRAYCAGVDVQEGGAETFGGKAHGKREEDQELGVTAESIAEENAYWTWRTPIIAAINGAAIGAGFTVPLLYDMRIAAEDAKLAFNFARLGIVAEANSTWILPRIAGVGRALELLLTGRRITGREAEELGVVNRALPRDEVLPAALEIARDIAQNTAPASVALIKRLVHDFQQETDRRAAFVRETEVTWWAGELPDAVEGIMAMMEKRSPNWQVSKLVDFPEGLD